MAFVIFIAMQVVITGVVFFTLGRVLRLEERLREMQHGATGIAAVDRAYEDLKKQFPFMRVPKRKE